MHDLTSSKYMFFLINVKNTGQLGLTLIQLTLLVPNMFKMTFSYLNSIDLINPFAMSKKDKE